MAALENQELLVILNRARTLLSYPSTWASRHFAEDDEGRWAPVGSSRAARFNLEGALVKAAGRGVREALPAILEVFRQISPETMPRLRSPSSPLLTHAEALALLDDAMARLSTPAVVRESGIRPSAADIGEPLAGHPVGARGRPPR